MSEKFIVSNIGIPLYIDLFQYTNTNELNAWTYGSIAIINSGGIRTSISKGNVTYGDLLTTAPFEGTIDVGELTGSVIKDVFEHSVNENIYINSFMQFLQISGIRVIYDLRKPIGSRVISLKIKCRLCDIPRFEDYDPDATYRIILSSFLAKGGDGYLMIEDHLKNRIVGNIDVRVFQKYFEKMSPITTGIDDRIIVLQ